MRPNKVRRMLELLAVLAVVIGTAIGVGIATSAKADAAVHSIRVVVYWTGPRCIKVIAPLVSNPYSVGADINCGGYVEASWVALPGHLIGADPAPVVDTTTLGCMLYIDGSLDRSDYAGDNDLHDVNCLTTLYEIYTPRAGRYT